MPDEESVCIWSKDTNAFWASQVQKKPDRGFKAYASTLTQNHHITSIQIRFLNLSVYDYIYEHNPGQNITREICRHAAFQFFGNGCSDGALEGLSSFVQQHALDGRKYHQLVEVYGVETLFLIPPSLDCMM